MKIYLSRYTAQLPLIKRYYALNADRGLDFILSNLTVASGIHIIALCYYIKYLIQDSEEITLKIESLKEFYNCYDIEDIDIIKNMKESI